MIVHLSKAKHFWKNGKSATWIKSDKFDDVAFQKLKEEYENLKYSRKNYIRIDGKTLFLFYQSKKDFHGRSTTEITALQMDEQINDIDSVFESIKNQIHNPFDDTLEYGIELSNDLFDKKIENLTAEKKVNWIIYTIPSILILATVIYFILPQKENIMPLKRELPKPAKIELNIEEKNESVAKVPIIEQEIEKSESKKPESKELGSKRWEWEEFCKKNSVEEPVFCYQSFINVKCKQKENYSQGYFEFASQGKNEHLCIDLNEIKDLSSDPDLKKQEFGYKEKEFFEGEE